MKLRSRGDWELELQAGQKHHVIKQNSESEVGDVQKTFSNHTFEMGAEVMLGDYDESDGTWQVTSTDGTNRSHWVHEDCLGVWGPSPIEVAEAIASITGGPLPPRQVEPTVAFLQGYTVMSLMTDWQEGKLPLKVTNIEQLNGPDGIYLNHCTVVTESGKRIRITFEEDA